MSNLAEWFLLPLAGGVAGFLTRALTTRRERKKSDLEIINSAITPLLTSIRELTEQNKALIDKLTLEQQASLDYMSRNKALLEERETLVTKIDKLTRQVEALKKLIREKLRSESDDLNNS